MNDAAVDVVVKNRRCSVGFVQRHLRIGYDQAVTLINEMEQEGIVSTADEHGKRQVLV